MGEGTRDAVRHWRGERLGLPAEGVGAVASFRRRVVAFLIDCVPCAVAAQLLTANPWWSATVFFAWMTVVSVSIFGRGPGHAVVGVRVAPLDGMPRPSFGQVVVRTLLICAAIPPLLTDADGRGLHDRVAGTVVLRTR